jgi:acyl-CoA hydrolase
VTERAKTVADSRITLHQLMLPQHANALGNVHGGLIMRLADEAGAICAMRHAQRPCVTVAMDSMTFRSAVHVGELLQLSAHINYVGRTSMEVGVEVTAENPITRARTHTNSAHLVFVALDDQGKPCGVPSMTLENDEERERWEKGKLRQERRKHER